MSLRFRYLAWALVPCLALGPYASSSAAVEPRYTYGEIGYVNVDLDHVDADGDGYALGGSYALHRNIHLLAGYQDIGVGGGRDADALSLGAGLNFPLRPGLDGIGRLYWIDSEIDMRSGNRSDTGWGVEAGFRTMIDPKLELNGFLRRLDIYSEKETTVVMGGLYGLTSNFAVGGELELSGDVTAFFLKARLYFNPPRQMR
ncbi:MAG: hypothetical protein AMXMBFR8_28960 [Nevskiales bacterium]